ncbi:MAG: sensor histidine kinase [Caldilineaceae bacterium]|nr:sensor histidine kinase [Caldilineaceae bacterium]
MNVQPTTDPNPATPSILEVNEQQLGRIVLDIHDGPVQYLYTALTLLEPLAQECEDDGDRAQLARVRNLIQSALYEIRACIGNIQPPEFEQRGLGSIINGLAIQHEEQTGNRVDLAVGALPEPIPLAVKIGLYRVLQEALANSYRHSGATVHFVRLWAEEGRIHMQVMDEGQGFTPPNREQAGERTRAGMGLRGMQDRIALLRGAFRVSSQPGQGTTINVWVPCDG